LFELHDASKKIRILNLETYPWAISDDQFKTLKPKNTNICIKTSLKLKLKAHIATET